MKEGWEYKKLGEVCTVLNGFAFKSGKYTDSGIISIYQYITFTIFQCASPRVWCIGFLSVSRPVDPTPSL